MPFFLPRDRAPLLALWLVGRLALFLFVVGLPFLPSLGAYNDDAELYLVWAHDIANGRFPFDDAMWQYPPLAGLVFLLAHVLTPNSISGFVMLTVAADAGIAFLLLRRPDIEGLRLWVFTPALVGPVMLGRFDLFPALLAVAALVAISRYPRIGAILISVGALLKVWPILIVSALRKPLASLMLIAATVSIFIALVLPVSGGALAFIKNQSDRGIQIESIWAAPYLAAKMFGASIEVPYQYGAREISASGVNALAVTSSVATLVSIGAIALMRWTGRLDHMSIAEVALTSIVASVAFSKVISPQYAMWVLAIVAVCLADGSVLAKRVTPLLAWWSFLGFALYPFLYDGLRDGFFFSVLVQLARTWLLLKSCAILFQWMVSGSTPLSIDARRPDGVSQVQFSSTHERPA